MGSGDVAVVEAIENIISPFELELWRVVNEEDHRFRPYFRETPSERDGGERPTMIG